MREYISSETITFYDDKFWFTGINNNNVYVYDFNVNKCFHFCTIDDEQQNGKRLFGTIIVRNGYLYLFPFSATQIYKIDIESREIKGIPLERPDKSIQGRYCPEAKFLSSHCYEDEIWILPASYPAILEYRIKDERIIYHKEWTNEIFEFINDKNENAFFRKTEMVENKLYAPLCGGNAVLIYDVSDNSYDIRQVGDKGCSYSSVCYDGEYFWLIPRGNSAIVKWETKSNRYSLNNVFPTDLKREKGIFNDVVCFEGHIIILPGNIGTILEIDRETGNSEIRYPQISNFYNAVQCKNNEKIYILSEAGIWIALSKDIQEPLFGCLYNPSGAVKDDFSLSMYHESKWRLLGEYIYCVVNKKGDIAKHKLDEDGNGKQIWKLLNKS